MRERSKRISRLMNDRVSRQSYVFSKISVLVPSQIKALRLRSTTPKQEKLAKAAGTHQSRLSMLEQGGAAAANVTLDTLAWIASIHKVGVTIKFVPFSEMLEWENSYSQDTFNITRLDADEAFLNPGPVAEISAFKITSDDDFGSALPFPLPKPTSGCGTYLTSTGSASRIVKNYDGMPKAGTASRASGSLTKTMQLVGNG